jgi:diguanylate cyclase (GGDEF)-like protein
MQSDFAQDGDTPGKECTVAENISCRLAARFQSYIYVRSSMFLPVTGEYGEQSMDIARMRSFMTKHRTSLKDLSILIALILVGLYLTFEFDISKNSDGVSVHERTIELDDALLLGGIVALGLLAFSVRRYVEQRRETARRLTAEQHVRTLAFQDALTGLANRRQFNDAIKAAAAAPPREGAVHALILLDLNGFKQVNDVYGHGIGDQVLTIVAQRLLGTMRDGDLAARLGGDEFAILALHLVGPEAATNVALRVIEALKEPITVGSTRHQIGAGLGISLIPGDATTPEQALRKADLALYRAKEERRSAVRFLKTTWTSGLRNVSGLYRSSALRWRTKVFAPISSQPFNSQRNGLLVLKLCLAGFTPRLARSCRIGSFQ